MINSRNRLKWIGQSSHRNYTNSTRNDEEAVKIGLNKGIAAM